jgi:hypothetical protein
MVSIYPNPVTGTSIQIKLKSILDAPTQIAIFDSQGKLAEQFSQRITWLNNPIEYDLSKLQAGLYLIQVKVGNQVATLKFVKL